MLKVFALFMTAGGMDRSAAEYNAFANANNFHSLFLHSGKHIDIRCPHLDARSLGGPWVDDAYCKSFCQGKGCKELNSCLERFKAGYKNKNVGGKPNGRTKANIR